MLDTVALRTKPIWADTATSIADLTFPYTYHEDLLIPPVINTANQLRLTFTTIDFSINHVKVFFDNGCFVQYYSDPYP